MFKRNALLLASTAFIALGLLSGCELEEDTVCTTNADCADGEECANIDAETGEGTCQPVSAATCGEDSQCSNGFACDTAAGACFDTCTADAGCAEGYTCTDGACAADEDPTWPYVAIVSATTADDDINDTNTPGPDIDAIELVSGGTSHFASTVVKHVQGAGGDSDGFNANMAVAAVTGANDAIPSGSTDCDLSEDPNALFWSMGDTTGFVVVDFGQDLMDGDTLRVWELDNIVCDISTERADAYAAFAGNSESAPSGISAAADISGDNWLSLGQSGGFGGMTDFTIDLP